MSIDTGTTSATPASDGEISLQHSNQPYIVRHLTQVRCMARSTFFQSTTNQRTHNIELNFIL